METEIWKDVKGYEGYYQVSNMGRVKSMRVLKTPKNGVKCRKNTFLSTKTSHDKQYILVALCRDGERKQVQVHRLVAEALPQTLRTYLSSTTKTRIRAITVPTISNGVRTSITCGTA